MRIKIDSLEFVYKLLKNPPPDEYEPITQGEEWKEDKPDESQRITPFFFPFPSARLLAPLDDAGIHFKRFGRNYSAIIAIDSFDKKAYKGTCKEFSKRLEEIDLEFINNNPLLDNSTGKVFNGTSYIFTIISANQGALRVIGLGTNGAYTMRFPRDFETFQTQIESLEDIANRFIDCLLQPYEEDEQLGPHIRKAKNEIVYLNP
jgi:hypothetical protein